jgi:hypothetical protein
MKKVLLTLTLSGLVIATGFVASAQDPAQRQAPPAQQQQQQQPQQQQQMSPDEIFSRLDADRDGKLSQEEFSRAMAGQASDDEKKQEFGNWDANKDGGISKEEFSSKYAPGGRR